MSSKQQELLQLSLFYFGQQKVFFERFTVCDGKSQNVQVRWKMVVSRQSGKRWCVEMVGCCSFSNSRSFAACFLQITLHKQAWLTWYLRKLNNSQAHGSLWRVCTVSCVIVPPGFSVLVLLELPEWVQASVTVENAAGTSNLVPFVWLTAYSWPLEMWSCGGCRGQSADVILSAGACLLFLNVSFYVLGSFWCSAAWFSLCSQPSQLTRTSHPTVSSFW